MEQANQRTVERRASNEGSRVFVKRPCCQAFKRTAAARCREARADGLASESIAQRRENKH
eukprot:6283129-Pyramimonas_sp.AAC.1